MIRTDDLSFKSLKEKQRADRANLPDALGLRVHRALSWLGRAEIESGDADVRFIMLWISFNSAYAADLGEEEISERGAFKEFFDTLVALDKENRIYNAVWDRFPHEIRILLSNQYIFAPFWANLNGRKGFEDWQEKLTVSQRSIATAIAKKDTTRILSVVFDRLYVLRNQIIHGGATWNSSVNRQQVNDGAAVLGWLVPIFIEILMSNPTRNWGKPFYPVVE